MHAHEHARIFPTGYKRILEGETHEFPYVLNHASFYLFFVWFGCSYCLSILSCIQFKSICFYVCNYFLECLLNDHLYIPRLLFRFYFILPVSWLEFLMAEVQLRLWQRLGRYNGLLILLLYINKLLIHIFCIFCTCIFCIFCIIVFIFPSLMEAISPHWSAL